MPKMFAKKDPFADLDSDFKDAVAGSSPEEIRKRIAQIAIDEENNRNAKDDDEDLKEKKEQAKIAGEQYAEATKAHRNMIRYCKRVLEDKGNA